MSSKFCDLCRIQGISPPPVADHKCVNCSFYFCSSCQAAHATNLNTKHHTFQSAEVFSNSSEIFDDICATHNKEKELFCSICGQVICISCKFDNHDGHKTDFVRDLITDVRRKLMNYLSKLQEQEDNLLIVSKDAAAKKTMINDNFNRTILDIERRRSELIALIDNWHEKNLEKIKAFHAKNIEQLGIEGLENSVKVLLENSSSAKEALKNGSDSSILCVWQKVQNYEETLEKQPTAEIPSVCNFIPGSCSISEEKTIFGEVILNEKQVEIKKERVTELEIVKESDTSTSNAEKKSKPETPNKVASTNGNNYRIYPLNSVKTVDVRTGENRPGLFRSFLGVAACESVVSMNDKIYVADPYSKSISIFDSCGAFIKAIDLEFSPKCIGKMKSGELIITSGGSAYVYSESSLIRESAVTFREAFGAVEINDEEIAVSDRGEGDILILDSKTLDLKRKIKGGGGWPSYLAIDGKSCIYAVFTGWAKDSLKVFDSKTGKKIREYVSKSEVEFGEVKGICVDNNNNILLSDSEKQSILICYDHNGVWEVLETKEVYDLDKPSDVTFRNSNELWILDLNRLKVYEYATNENLKIQ